MQLRWPQAPPSKSQDTEISCCTPFINAIPLVTNCRNYCHTLQTVSALTANFLLRNSTYQEFRLYIGHHLLHRLTGLDQTADLFNLDHVPLPIAVQDQG